MRLAGLPGTLPTAVRRWYRPVLVVGLAVTTTVLAVAFGGRGPGEGLLFDVLVYARARLAPPVNDPRASSVVIVAIDQESLDAEELKDRPRALMAPEWARIIDALFGAGARVIGFDALFVYSGSQLIPEFDAPMLEALARHRDRIVLARSESTLPYIGYMGAVGAMEDPDRLGMAALEPDSDGVFRRVRGALATGEPTLTRVVLSRAGFASPSVVLLAPDRHMETLPTYAMADVLRCAAKQPEALRLAFAGKIVMVGGTHPDEDRKLSSSRWLEPPTEREPPLAACGLRRLPASASASPTVPGVHVHAAALEAVASGRITVTAPPPIVGMLAGGAALVAAWLGLLLSPWLTALAVLGACVVLFLLATAALAYGVWVPLALPLIGLVTAPAVSYVTRYLFEERLRRRIADAFTLFAPRHLVEQLAEEGAALQFGGEEREITIMFADLSGSTDLSGRIAPADLMKIVNDHLAAIANAVEHTDGYVDKFIGDAVMGLWGAPLSHSHHALGAVRAAIRAERAVAELGESARDGARLSVKIGVNSGRAIVGLVGTPQRYNYTAVGEPVNIASRLEGLPPLYGCRIVIGETTAALVGDEILLRELDRVLVKGAVTASRIFQPIAEVAAATPEQESAVKRFAEALALYRARRFEEAAELWEQLAALEPAAIPGHAHVPPNPPAALARQARKLAKEPPPPDWDGVTVLTSK